MSSYEEILIGRSTPLMEVDDEESSLDHDISEAILDADFYDIINHLNTKEFRNIYLNLYNEIIFLPFDDQKNLCDRLLNKIFEEYNFEFTPSLTFDNQNDINEFLKFVEFLEFNNIDFIASIITGLNLDLLKKNLDKFLEVNFESILVNIEKKLKNEVSKIISIFFRTNNKENIFKFLKSKLEKDKMLIILKSMEGVFLENEWYNYY